MTGSGIKNHMINPCFQLYEPSRLAPRDLLTLLRKIEREAAACESGIREEREKRRKHRVDDARRVHNYDEFVTTFISMLAEQGRQTTGISCCQWTPQLIFGNIIAT